MLVLSPDSAYVLKPDGSTRTVERPDAAADPDKRGDNQHRRTSRTRRNR